MLIILNIFCNELIVVNIIDIKNNIVNSCLNGICLKIFGIVINIKDGLVFVGYLNVKDVGIIIKVVIIVVIVLNIFVCNVLLIIFFFLFKYVL